MAEALKKRAKEEFEWFEEQIEKLREQIRALRANIEKTYEIKCTISIGKRIFDCEIKEVE